MYTRNYFVKLLGRKNIYKIKKRMKIFEYASQITELVNHFHREHKKRKKGQI